MANTETYEPSSTTRVRVEELPARQTSASSLRVVTPEPEAAAPVTPAPPPPSPPPDDNERTLAALKAIAMILSARALVFASMSGGFVLGVCALIWPDWQRLAVLIAYGLFVIGPAIYLELKRR